MKTCSVIRIFFVAVFLLGLATAGLAAQVPTLEPARVSQTHEIDGDLSDVCWQEAKQVPDFYLYDREEKARTQTEAFVAYDDHALYVAFRCLEPNPAKLVANAQPGVLDAAVSRDDVIEVFVSPGTDRGTYYHFFVNAANARRDQRVWGSPYPDIRDDGWNGNWQSGTRVGAKDWTVEMAIPWSNFGLDQDTDRWRIMLCRGKRTDPLELSSWPYCDGQFHNRFRFAALTTPQVDFTALLTPQIHDLAVASYGIDQAGYYYTVTGAIKNRRNTASKVLVAAEDIPKVGKGSQAQIVVEIPEKQKTKPFELNLRMARPGERRLSARLLDPETKQVLFSGGLDAESFPRLMQAYLDRNYYTNEKQARGIVHLNIPNGKERFTVELEIRPATQKPIKARGKVRDPEKTVIPFSLSKIPLGKHAAEFRILDSQGQVMASETTMLRKEPPAPPPIREVKVDRERICVLVEGKPFFPIGIYGVPPEYMKQVAEAEFNCTICWSPGFPDASSRLEKALEISEQAGREVINQYLDASQKAGLLVLEWPIAFGLQRKDGMNLYYGAPNFSESWARFLKEVVPFVVETCSKHPAILAYYGPDEPAKWFREQSREHSQVVSKIDPYRPNFILFASGIRGVWPEVYDIAGIDWYFKERRTVTSCLRPARAAAQVLGRNRIPYWHVPLCEWCGGSVRGLSGAEQRIQSYLCVIGGAKGILWFVWPPRYHGNWEELKKLASEFTALTPVLTEAAPAQTVRHERAEMEETVQVLVQEHAGKTYLITANASEYEAEATFTLPDGFSGKAKVWFEDRSRPIKDSRFTDHFEGYGRHVYELASRWPSGETATVAANLGERKQPGALPILPYMQTAAGPKNLLPNSGFKNVSLPGWPDYWMPPAHTILTPGFIGGEDSPWESDHAVAFEGQKSLRMTKREPFMPTAAMWYVPVKRAGDHTLSVYLKADRPDVRVRLCLTRGSREVRVSTEWARYSCTDNLDPGRTAHINIRLEDEATLWLDAAQLEEGTQPTAYEGTD